jgi:hypothetical protein
MIKTPGEPTRDLSFERHRPAAGFAPDGLHEHGVPATVAYAAERAYVLAYFDRTPRSKGPIPTRINSFPGVRATGN